MGEDDKTYSQEIQRNVSMTLRQLGSEFRCNQSVAGRRQDGGGGFG